MTPSMAARGSTGLAAVAEDACRRALALSPSLWQSHLVMGKAQKLNGDMMQADESFKAVLRSDASNAQARVALADLYMNTFGQPMTAVALVKPLLSQAEHAEDAELTTLMAGLYDRDTSAEAHNQGVMDITGAAYRPQASERSQADPAVCGLSASRSLRGQDGRYPKPVVSFAGVCDHAGS